LRPACKARISHGVARTMARSRPAATVGEGRAGGIGGIGGIGDIVATQGRRGSFALRSALSKPLRDPPCR
jgi:hypothetical protein